MSTKATETIPMMTRMVSAMSQRVSDFFDPFPIEEESQDDDGDILLAVMMTLGTVWVGWNVEQLVVKGFLSPLPIYSLFDTFDPKEFVWTILWIK